MTLDAIRFVDAPGQSESLALALISVAAAHGARIEYDALCAALGLSCTAVSTVAEPSPGWWMTFGRDAFLGPAARLFGFEVRDLHPPDVAVDMISAEEFGQHWDVSYKPLIRAALANGQPVLAWQGWSGVQWPFWGVITAPAGECFTGYSLWSSGPLLLDRPALQCCVVERFEPSMAAPPRDRLLAMALHHTDQYLSAAPLAPRVPGPAAPTVVTGPAAYDAWETWLASDAAVRTPDAWNEHRQHADFIAAGHASAAEFFRSMQEVAPRQIHGGMQEAIRLCDLITDLLASSRDPDLVSSLFQQQQGREELLSAVRTAEAHERLLADVVHEWSAALGPGR